MDIKTFCALENELAQTHAGLADELGLSEISIKRMATGAQVINDRTARQLIARVLIEREGKSELFSKLLAKYHGDTL
ncbi:MAG: hypothetical protein Q7S87_08565 [Agitococcus sp.]|nr:hypothetical protein [Agitococcus sp.]MDO9177622.1 hypothetical protein [Agitococcus sp.]